jgi:hypothetical protein
MTTRYRLLLIPLFTSLLVPVCSGQENAVVDHDNADIQSRIALNLNLKRLKALAIVEYSGQCHPHNFIDTAPIQLNELPPQSEEGPASIQLNELPPQSKDDASAALRILFAKDKRFTQFEQQNGVFIVAQAGITQDFLNIHIHKLMLDKVQQYNVPEAIEAIFDAPEVKTYMSTNNISPEPLLIDHLLQPSIPSLPHLKSQLEDLTVLDFLKVILKSFSGQQNFILYNECLRFNGSRVIGFLE